MLEAKTLLFSSESFYIEMACAHSIFGVIIGTLGALDKLHMPWFIFLECVFITCRSSFRSFTIVVLEVSIG